MNSSIDVTAASVLIGVIQRVPAWLQVVTCEHPPLSGFGRCPEVDQLLAVPARAEMDAGLVTSGLRVDRLDERVPAMVLDVPLLAGLPPRRDHGAVFARAKVGARFGVRDRGVQPNVVGRTTLCIDARRVDYPLLVAPGRRAKAHHRAIAGSAQIGAVWSVRASKRDSEGQRRPQGMPAAQVCYHRTRALKYGMKEGQLTQAARAASSCVPRYKSHATPPPPPCRAWAPCQYIDLTRYLKT